MRFVRGLSDSRDSSLIDQPCVLTIGNFDGVHLGHQAIFTALRERAEANNAMTVVVFFEPQPMEFFNSAKAPSRISSLREKLALFHDNQIDCALMIKFNRAFSELSAEQFCDRLLRKALNTIHVIIGDDFRYGKNRQAGFTELVDFGEHNGISVEQTSTCEFQGQRISSSWVRQALDNGDFELVEQLLGKPFHLCGRVSHGDKRGRTLGYPTANIYLKRHRSPVKGVFVTTAIDSQGRRMPAVSNVGIRPVFAGQELLLETHLLEFSGDIYGEMLHVEFHHRLRDEKQFSSVDELKKQIDLDAQHAREFHQQMNRTL